MAVQLPQAAFFLRPLTLPSTAKTTTTASDKVSRRLGDLNNDGFDDFAVGAPFADGNKGRVYIIFGGPRNSITTGSIATPSRVIINGEGFFWLRIAAQRDATAVPDINGDTRADLIVSAPTETVPNSAAKGQVYVFFGRATYPAAPNKLVLNKGDATFEDLRLYNDTSPPLSRFAAQISITDLNHDGQTDLLAYRPLQARK